MNLLLYAGLGCIVLALARRLAILVLGWTDTAPSLGSLCWRVALSAGLFAVLLLGVPLGWWRRQRAPAFARHAGQ